MQNNPQQKFSQPPRPGNSGFRPGGNWSDRRWSEEKALTEIRECFGENCFDEILEENKKDYNIYIGKVKNYVDKNKRGITTSQLRNVFTTVKNTESILDLYRLRPKLAYVSGRAGTDEMKTLLFLLDELITRVSEKNIDQFKAFFESVIAYHKYFGGKE